MWARGFVHAHVLVFLLARLLAPVALPLIARRRAPELVMGAVFLGMILAVSGIAGFVLHRRGARDSSLLAHAAGVAVLVCVGSFLLVPAANRKAAVRDFGAELAALARPDDYLVVDREGYEQILFYSRLKGARRDVSAIRFSYEADALVMESGSKRKDRSESGPPSGERPRAGSREEPRAGFAGAVESAYQRVVFPPGARVLFVTPAPRADRLRARIGPSSRVLLASKIYGRPYVVIASR